MADLPLTHAVCARCQSLYFVPVSAFCPDCGVGLEDVSYG